MSDRLFLKRMQGEKNKLAKSPSELCDAVFNDGDPYNIYILLVGPPDSPFEGGRYLGKIMITSKFPFEPPDFMMFTPSGRFEINHKICLSNSGYHRDTASPAWSFQGIMMGMLSIMTDNKEHGISHIHEAPEKQKTYAEKSHEYNLKNHPDIYLKFKRFVDKSGKMLTPEPHVSKKKKIKDSSDKDKE